MGGFYREVAQPTPGRLISAGLSRSSAWQAAHPAIRAPSVARDGVDVDLVVLTCIDEPVRKAIQIFATEIPADGRCGLREPAQEVDDSRKLGTELLAETGGPLFVVSGDLQNVLGRQRMEGIADQSRALSRCSIT